MILIGIDTGANTGWAVWDTEQRKLTEVATKHIHRALADALALYAKAKAEGDHLVIIFEDARQRKWIPREKNVSQYRGRLMGAGSVKRDAVIWEEFCTDNDIAFSAVAPRKGATKWDERQFRALTGWKGRTSNHARDAALLVWGR